MLKLLELFRPATVLITVLALWPSLAAAQATKAGVVTTLEGNVTVTRVTVAPQPLKFKDDVFVNDKVTTGERSIARMLLGGKAVVTARERSTLTITEIPGKATIDLEAGKIALAVAKDKMRPGESIEIRAGNAVAGIRGTVVVAEVSSASASLEQSGLTGTFWVLQGQIEALLTNVPGSTSMVGTMQQFRGGVVTNFPTSQIGQIVQGLSTGQLPATKGGDDQAKEQGIIAGIALANSFTAVSSVVGRNITLPPPVVSNTTPILPGNAGSFQPVTPPLPPATSSPTPPPTPPHHYRQPYCHGL